MIAACWPQDLHGMVDASKYADLVLLMVDGAFGFEMETFEFLNLLQVQGFPKVMGVLTHLDSFKDPKKLKKTKKALKHRFWAEIYQGKPTLHDHWHPGKPAEGANQKCCNLPDSSLLA